MCGIVGYIGDKRVSEILLDGMERLEYRGYDSAGIALVDGNELKIEKYKGRLSILREEIEGKYENSRMGIGHTRWATHGEPSDINSHPHYNEKNTIAVVHNGIIENYMKLREELTERGYKFLSQTDTEVIPHLLDFYYTGDIVETVKIVVSKLEGSYALGVIDKNDPEKIVAVRKDSPLIVGLGQGENFIASDIPAVLKYTRDIYFLEDGEMAILTKEEVKIFDRDGKQVDRQVYRVKWDLESAEKMGYDHFMIKEIHEQPLAIKNTVSPRIDEDGNIKIDEIDFSSEEFKKINKIYIIACGTAYHAGLMGKAFIEEMARIPITVEVASEFRYSNPFIDENTLIILVSQSGETADTLAALRLGREKKSKTLALTNVVGSTLSREADYLFYTWAGPEISVASTKAYTTQIVSLLLLALDMSHKMGKMSQEEVGEIVGEIHLLPEKIGKILENVDNIRKIAKDIHMWKDAFFIGRGIDYYLSMEGSLKLKEVSYIHSEAMAAGELKHGTLALIEEGIPVIAMATQDELFDKMLSNITEVKARGAKVIGVANENHREIEKSVDDIIYIPSTIKQLNAILGIIPLQVLAYYVARENNCDIDKPKNLAKSVTVE